MVALATQHTRVASLAGTHPRLYDLNKQAGGIEMATEMKTDATLLERLQRAASKPITKSELERQRVSFVYGNLPRDSTVTKDRVEHRIRKNEGA